MIIAQGRGESASRRPGLGAQNNYFPLPASPRAGRGIKGRGVSQFDCAAITIVTSSMPEPNHTGQSTGSNLNIQHLVLPSASPFPKSQRDASKIARSF